MMLLLLTWHCYFVAFHVSSHNNVMSESQTWDIELLFMFQCEGSNSHIETYKSCISAWVIISFLDFMVRPFIASDTFELSLQLWHQCPVRMLRNKSCWFFVNCRIMCLLILTSPKSCSKRYHSELAIFLVLNLSK